MKKLFACCIIVVVLSTLLGCTADPLQNLEIDYRIIRVGDHLVPPSKTGGIPTYQGVTGDTVVISNRKDLVPFYYPYCMGCTIRHTFLGRTYVLENVRVDATGTMYCSVKVKGRFRW